MKLTILQGLPGSGKSTKAAEILKTSGNTVRISKDNLREMLHCDVWSGPNEKLTKSAARALAKHFLTSDRNVVIDETNLNPGTLQGWKDLGKELEAKVEVIAMDTPLADCLRHDAARGEARVGDSVIIGMAMRSGLYPEPANGIVICDLDGTLANIDHRLHFMRQKPKDWKGFFGGISEDTLRQDVLDLILEHEKEGREIFFVSGRPETYRDVTEEWLERVLKGYKIHRALFMRRHGDRRPDDIVKQEIYDAHFKDLEIVEVLDDRPRIILMWKRLGLNVRDVGSNEYFEEERAELNYISA